MLISTELKSHKKTIFIQDSTKEDEKEEETPYSIQPLLNINGIPPFLRFNPPNIIEHIGNVLSNSNALDMSLDDVIASEESMPVPTETTRSNLLPILAYDDEFIESTREQRDLFLEEISSLTTQLENHLGDSREISRQHSRLRLPFRPPSRRRRLNRYGLQPPLWFSDDNIHNNPPQPPPTFHGVVSTRKHVPINAIIDGENSLNYFYFEASVESVGIKGTCHAIVGFILGSGDYFLNSQYQYHSDSFQSRVDFLNTNATTGISIGIYLDTGEIFGLSPTSSSTMSDGFNVGDRVGIGISVREELFFFTKNGKKIQTLDASHFIFNNKMNKNAILLYPAIKLKHFGESVGLHFGPHFSFNFDKYSWEQMMGYKQQQFIKMNKSIQKTDLINVLEILKSELKNDTNLRDLVIMKFNLISEIFIHNVKPMKYSSEELYYILSFLINFISNEYLLDKSSTIQFISFLQSICDIIHRNSETLSTSMAKCLLYRLYDGFELIGNQHCRHSLFPFTKADVSVFIKLLEPEANLNINSFIVEGIIFNKLESELNNAEVFGSRPRIFEK